MWKLLIIFYPFFLFPLAISAWDHGDHSGHWEMSEDMWVEITASTLQSSFAQGVGDESEKLKRFKLNLQNSNLNDPKYSHLVERVLNKVAQNFAVTDMEMATFGTLVKGNGAESLRLFGEALNKTNLGLPSNMKQSIELRELKDSDLDTKTYLSKLQDYFPRESDEYKKIMRAIIVDESFKVMDLQKIKPYLEEMSKIGIDQDLLGNLLITSLYDKPQILP